MTKATKTPSKKSSAKKATKKVATKATKVKAKAGKVTSKKKSPANRTLKKKLSSTTKAESEEQSKIDIAKLNAPSREMLRPFRKAAKLNKKLAKDKARLKKGTGAFLSKPPRRGKRYCLDLRIHTPGTVGYFYAGGISPGPALVRLASVKGLDMIGLTDFYNVSYIDIVRESLQETESKLTILPGFDMKCSIDGCEEVFVTALFTEDITSDQLYSVLDELNVPQSAYGNRNYCLKEPFGKIIEVVEKNDGIIIPSRLDKTPHRQKVIPILVEEYGIRAFDLLHPNAEEIFRERWPSGGFTFFSFSNARALGQIGSRTAEVKLEENGFSSLRERIQRQFA